MGIYEHSATIGAIWLWVGFFIAFFAAKLWGDKNVVSSGPPPTQGAGPPVKPFCKRGCIFASIHFYIYAGGIAMGFCLMMSGIYGVFGGVKDELEDKCEDSQDLYNWFTIMALPQGILLYVGHHGFQYFRFIRKQTCGTPSSLWFCTFAQIVQISSIYIWFTKVKNTCDGWTEGRLYTAAIWALCCTFIIFSVMLIRAYTWLSFGSVTRAATWYFNTDGYAPDKLESSKSQPDLPTYVNQRWVFLTEQARSLLYFTFLLLCFVGYMITYFFIDINFAENPLVDTFGLANICIYFDFPPSNYVLPWFWACCLPLFFSAVWGMYIRCRVEFQAGKMSNLNWTLCRLGFAWTILSAVSFSIIFAVSPQDHMPDTIQIHTIPFMMLQIAVCLMEFNAVWYGVNYGWKNLGFSNLTITLAWVYAYTMCFVTVMKFCNDFNAIMRPAQGWGIEAEGLLWKPMQEPMSSIFEVFDKCWFIMAAGFPVVSNVILTFWYGDKLPLFTIDLTQYNPRAVNDPDSLYLNEHMFPPNPWVDGGMSGFKDSAGGGKNIEAEMQSIDIQ